MTTRLVRVTLGLLFLLSACSGLILKPDALLKRFQSDLNLDLSLGADCKIDSKGLVDDDVTVSEGLADSVMSYQRTNWGDESMGGWYKSEDYGTDSGCKESDDDALKDYTIFDNRATTSEIRYMAKAGKQLKKSAYRKSAIKGIKVVLAAQYPQKLDGKTLLAAGGWPQQYGGEENCENNGCYPAHDEYARDVTYNDDLHYNIMKLLKDIYEGTDDFDEDDYDDLRADCKTAWEAGIQAILNTQIIANGVKTGWGAQYVPETAFPSSARSYELASVSGGEGPAIASYLMTISDPSTEIKQAICAAAAWYESAKFTGWEIDYTNEDTYCGSDTEPVKARYIKEKDGAGPTWARFYSLRALPDKEIMFSAREACEREDKVSSDTLVCTAGDYDSSKVSFWKEGESIDALDKAFQAIGSDRRDCYGFTTTGPEDMLEEFEAWKKDHSCPSDLGTSPGIDISASLSSSSTTASSSESSCKRGDATRHEKSSAPETGDACATHCSGYAYAVFEEDGDCGCYTEYPCESTSGDDTVYTVLSTGSATESPTEEKRRRRRRRL